MHVAIKTFSILLITALSLIGKSRLAVIELRGNDIPHVEISVVSGLVRDRFVNSGVFDVLDRENIDKILREQSMQNYGLMTDSQAVVVGKILNVEKIVVGTVTRLQQQLFLEMRIINIQTSSIERSKTALCSSDELLSSMRNLADQLCTPVGPQPHDMQSRAAEKSFEFSSWNNAGLSRYDYNRFVESKLTLDEWTYREFRSPATAAFMGAIPLLSGFYHTNDYATGVLITLLETMGAVGMLRSVESGTPDYPRLYTFGSLIAVTTIIDVIGSYSAASSGNKALDGIRISAGLSPVSSYKQIAVIYSQNF